MSIRTESDPPGTVLITGAAAGIGRAAAILFAHEGWRCVLVDHDAQRLQQLQEELETHHAHPHVCKTVDLTDAAKLPEIALNLPELDALINNAGISQAGATALEPLQSETSARLVSLNLLAPARVVQTCHQHLKRHARIANVTSGAALRAIPARGLYSPSKSGLLEQTRALARARPHWTVTSLAPGFVRTELVQQLLDSGNLRAEQVLAKVPLGRIAEPWEMAQALFFLGTQAPPQMSGHTLVVCGGSSVYGGSQSLAAANYACLPPDSVLDWHITASSPQAWHDIGLVNQGSWSLASRYEAMLDASALRVPAGHVLKSVQGIASTFYQQASGPASLTLLLPSRAVPWEHAGDLAASRMLVSTLAVEWGSQGLRINALEISDAQSPSDYAPLIRYVGGPTAQYLTGQTFCLGHNPPKDNA